MECLAATELHREVGLQLGLDDSTALANGAFVGEERVLLLHDAALEDGAYVCIDAGPLDPHTPPAEVLAALLDLNLELSAQRGESFGIDAETGNIVFRAFRRNGEFTSASLAEDIRTYLEFFEELRAGPLAGCLRPHPANC